MNDTKRKEIKIEQDGREIVVKLWNEISKHEVKVGETLLIMNLHTRSFKGVISLNSTDETVIEVCYFYIIVQLFNIIILLGSSPLGRPNGLSHYAVYSIV